MLKKQIMYFSKVKNTCEFPLYASKKFLKIS